MLKITSSILCYNYGRYLAKAIESCLQQEPGSFELEILVIDDGSTDETPAVCARFGDRIRVSRSANLGFGASLGRGLLEASGDYVCFLDADDYFHPRKLRALLPYMERGDLFISHDSHWIDEAGNLLDELSHPGMTSTLCLRRDAALEMLPVPNERFFHALEQPGRSARPDLPLTYYRHHPASMQNNPAPGDWHETLAAVNRGFIVKLDALIDHPPAWVTSVRKLADLRTEAHLWTLFATLEAALERGQRLAAFSACWSYLVASLRRSALSLLTLKMIIRTFLGLPVYRRGTPEGAERARPMTTFDRIAYIYDDSLPRHVARHYLEKRSAFLGSLFRPADRLLDVGCGTGTLALHLRSLGFRVTGLDASQAMLAAQRTGRPPAIQALADRMPFPDGSFDGAYCVAVLHHLIDPAVVAGAIHEMVRVTRPGGAVVIWDHNPLNPYWPLLMRRVPQDDGSERLVPLREITGALERHRDLAVAWHRSGFVPDFLPSRLLPLGRRLESVLEATPLVRRFAAHNVVVARKAPPCG